ncbi:dihydrolipoamide acetyltransferase family protein [Parafrigoribacterium mesophilum]|uniref:dihydrolipoamide acetyltransferase family protein n=1 Tax=Parafrigoribacterium mesophilum TaxID=433646 RepID=UPI0031FD4CD0
MSRQFLLPDLGEGLTEAEIVGWLVAPGDTVAVDQPVVEVESAKSVVELPSPFAGVVESLHHAAGQTVWAGEPLLSISETASKPVESTRSDAAPEVVEAVPGTALREPAASVAAQPATASGAVLIGYGLPERSRTARPTPRGRFGARRDSIRGDSIGRPDTAPPAPRRSPVVSPLVRKLAKDHGFNASDLAGSGAGSLVLRSDVQSHIAALASAPSAAGDTRIPIAGVRKLVAEKMSLSRREIPEATIWLDVDATALIAAKNYLQQSTGDRWSVNTLIARFVVAGLKRYPILNSSVDSAAGEIVQHARINLGIAAQTPHGLMVPVVQDAGSLTTDRLRASIGQLGDRARNGTFPAEQLRGGTFTLNNYGGFGVDGSAAIINHPEVAILGIGRITDRPWVVDGELAVRKVVVLSLVFDHRVCDGDIPSQFIGFIARCIENPVTLLADL